MTWTGTRAADIDTSMRLGMAYTQGPLAWADALGAARVAGCLANLQRALRRCPLPARAAAFGAAPFTGRRSMAEPTGLRSRPPTPSRRTCSRTIARRKALGMRIVAISEGAAFLEMAVRDDMLNGFDICHGGFITTLADSAFAFACNSTGDVTVAAGLSVDFLAPGEAAATC